MTGKGKALLLGSLLIGGLAVVMTGGKKAHAASRPVLGPKPGDTPAKLAELAAKALATRNPAVIRRVANELAARGYEFADDLRDEGARLEAAQRGTATPGPVKAKPKKGSGGAPVEVVKDQKKSADAKAAAALLEAKRKAAEALRTQKAADERAALEAAQKARDAADAAAALRREVEEAEAERSRAYEAARLKAATLTLHLQQRARGKEDQRLVMAFQEQEGLKLDGLYGPKTAAEIASFGVVPVAPYYWPKADTARAKRDYQAILLDAGRQYPSKAAEFAAAAKKVV